MVQWRDGGGSISPRETKHSDWPSSKHSLSIAQIPVGQSVNLFLQSVTCWAWAWMSPFVYELEWSAARHCPSQWTARGINQLVQACQEKSDLTCSIWGTLHQCKPRKIIRSVILECITVLFSCQACCFFSSWELGNTRLRSWCKGGFTASCPWMTLTISFISRCFITCQMWRLPPLQSLCDLLKPLTLWSP